MGRGRELNTRGECQFAKKEMQPGGREGAGKKVHPSSRGLTTPQTEQGQPKILVSHNPRAICFRKPANVRKRVLRSYSSTP